MGSDGRKWVWKEVGEPLNDRLVQGTVKFDGGNMMMWDCMGWDGVGYATRIEKKMDAELFVSILEDELQESLRIQARQWRSVCQHVHAVQVTVFCLSHICLLRPWLGSYSLSSLKLSFIPYCPSAICLSTHADC